MTASMLYDSRVCVLVSIRLCMGPSARRSPSTGQVPPNPLPRGWAFRVHSDVWMSELLNASDLHLMSLVIVASQVALSCGGVAPQVAQRVCVWPRGADDSAPAGRRRKERAWRCVVWPRGADGSEPGGRRRKKRAWRLCIVAA